MAVSTRHNNRQTKTNTHVCFLKPFTYTYEVEVRLDHCIDPVNIGSEEMVTINQPAEMIAEIAGKKLSIKHIPGPLGVRGRNSDNKLIEEKLGWKPSMPLKKGLEITYKWIEEEVKEAKKNTPTYTSQVYTYEVYSRAVDQIFIKRDSERAGCRLIRPFVKRQIYEKYGYLNLDFSLAADYELMLRFLYKYEVSTTCVPKVLVKMRTGGTSTPGVYTAGAVMENYRSWKRNGLKYPVTVLLKPLSKVLQFFK